MLQTGTDINVHDDQYNTALYCAAILGSVEIINILLDKGMCIDMTNGDDWTPLHVSAMHGNASNKSFGQKRCDFKQHY
ncbi:MAG: ankyrin repeat domain-containing protein [Nitrososphaerota archaeon]|nr:ankyrin repeat domain-containing protein [Nitrososphaerota archaeon]